MAYKRTVRPVFTLCHENVELLLHLPSKQFKVFIMGLLAYSNDLAQGNEPVAPYLTGWGLYIWLNIVRKIERDHQEYVAGAIVSVIGGQPRSTAVNNRKGNRNRNRNRNRNGSCNPSPAADFSVGDGHPPERTAAPGGPTNRTVEADGRTTAFTPPIMAEINAFCEAPPKQKGSPEARSPGGGEPLMRVI